MRVKATFLLDTRPLRSALARVERLLDAERLDPELATMLRSTDMTEMIDVQREGYVVVLRASERLLRALARMEAELTK